MHEARRRSIHIPGIFGREIDLLPWAPIAIGVINVAAAGKEFIRAFATHLRLPPARKIPRVEDVAVVGSLTFRPRADHEELAQIARRSVQVPVRSFGEPGDLVDAELLRETRPRDLEADERVLDLLRELRIYVVRMHVARSGKER